VAAAHMAVEAETVAVTVDRAAMVVMDAVKETNFTHNLSGRR
jgi:hypothetical protein